VAGLLQKVAIDLNPDPSHFKGANRPVEQVTWHEAEEFCLRLSKFTDLQYRLPTEAEWEYACRAGTSTPFHFGTTILPELANYDGRTTYANNPISSNRGETNPIDYFNVANEWGLCDIHGNIWEWCQDSWHRNYIGAPDNSSEWIVKISGATNILRGGSRASYQYDAPGDMENKVIRGGSWYADPRGCRSAFRFPRNPFDQNFDLGFRVACAGPLSQAKVW
jgi:formylglycine-generating enzyme required for sulfatase activity